MSVTWTDMPVFKGVDLTDSFVLAWSANRNDLVFEIEASLWPGSIHYESPGPNEHTCYKKAVLAFRNVEEIEGLLPMEKTRFSVDATGEKDFGNVDQLTQSLAGFTVAGDFGVVSITGGELQFEIET